MELAGVALGVVSLYNTSIDVLHRVDAYRGFNMESQTTLAHYDAAKLRLQNWAKMLGMSEGDLKSPHDARLDDPQTASVIKNMLRCLNKIFDKIEDTSGPFKPPARQRTLETFAWSTPFDDARGKLLEEVSTPTSKRTRIGWAAGGKSRLEKEVRSFESLVNILYDVVPPRADASVPAELERKLAMLSNIDSGLDTLLEIATTQKQKDAEDWLDAPKVDDQYEKHRSVRLDGTCDWILNHPAYMQWISEDDRDETAKLLWINAPAGFGKTVLSARIITHLKEMRNSPVAYCYSSNYAHGNEQLDAVVRAWITQLTREDEDALDLVQARRYKRKVPRATSEDIWALLREISSESEPFTLLLDGLDEFDSSEDRRKKFLHRLKKLISTKDVRVLITSRLEVDIESELRPTPTGTQDSDLTLFECRIVKENIQADIESFSHSIVTEKLPKQDISFRTELASEIADRCDGMFLWIKLQQDRLRSGKSKKDLRNIVQAMPQGLNQTYKRSWETIEALEEADRDRAVNTLRWLTFGYRPLTVQELAEALIVQLDADGSAFSEDDLPEDIDEDYIDGEIKGLCGSLIEVRGDVDAAAPSKTSTVHLVHASVREFLLKALPMSVWIREPSISPSEQPPHAFHHLELAALCIRFLDSPNVWDTDVSGSPRSFAEYAYESWYTHLKDSKGYIENAFQIIERFMTPENDNFVKWRRFLNLRKPSVSRLKDEEQPIGNALYYACVIGTKSLFDFFNSKSGTDINAIGGRCQTPLEVSCVWGCWDIFEILLQQKADVTIAGGDYGSALGAAAYFGRLEMVNELLNHENDQDSTSVERKQWALMLASQWGHSNIVKSLLRSGTTVNNSAWPDIETFRPGVALDMDMYRSALHVACQHGHLAIIEMLLEYQADTNIRNVAGKTPLILAASHGHLQAIKALLDSGVDIKARDTDGRTALWNAISEGNSEVAKYLLRQHDGDDADDKGFTLLHIAAERGQVDIMRLLLEKKTDVNKLNVNLWSALHSATFACSVEAVQLLLDHGAVVSEDSDLWTCLHVAAEKGDPPLIDCLFKGCKDLDVNAKHNSAWTPLHIAVYNQRTEVVKSLLDHGAKQLTDDSKWFPLHLAAQFGPVDVARLLLDQEGVLDAKNHGGYTPLRVAIFNEQYEVAQLLLDRGAKSDVRDESGESALHESIKKRHLDLFKRIVGSTQDLNAQSSIRQITPLHAAIEKGSDEMIDILIEYGASMSITDCYGMNGLSWLRALRPTHRILQDQGKEALYDISSEPDTTVIKKTVFDIASTLKNDNVSSDAPFQFRILAHSLAMLGYEDDAILLYSLRTLLDVDAYGAPYCDGCGIAQTADGAFYICRTCCDVDLCPTCMQQYTTCLQLDICKGHEFYEVIASQARFGPGNTEELNECLRGIIDRFKA